MVRLISVLQAVILISGAVALAQMPEAPEVQEKIDQVSPGPEEALSDPVSDPAALEETPFVQTRIKHSAFSSQGINPHMHVQADEIMRDDLVVMGGKALVEGKLKGDLVIFSGEALVSGDISGDLVIFGGHVGLQDTAVVHGSLVSFGGDLERSESAVIEGNIVKIPGGGWISSLIGGLTAYPIAEKPGPSPAEILRYFNYFTFIWWIIIGFLIVISLNRPIEKTSEVLRTDLLRALLAGALFLVLSFSVILGLTITVVGIPLAILGILAGFGVYIFAVAAGFTAIGGSLMGLLGRRAPSVLIAWMTGLLVLFLIRLAPFGMGFIVWIIWMTAAVGAVIISKFGTMKPWFTSNARSIPRPPEPPVPPPPAGFPHSVSPGSS